ncbi:MAG: YceD family protein [Ornithinimicrobium sp.]|uniref:YceD family protein n=1 Tax=Ornithinimicrobium sp. TaxID=1977084 RepID=UPI0026DF2AF7|nr:YceD family protein [Ornithinimicrobium sp.]MDO5740332.1 YceD family protein [Ornithinimicrobium sp.]
MAAHETERTWVVDTRELARRPGSLKEITWTLTTPERIGTDVIAIQPDQQVRMDLRMESVVEGVLTTGTASALASGLCVRCLENVEEDLEVHFQELFAYPERAAHHQKVAGHGSARNGSKTDDETDDEERYELDGDLLDLQEVVRDAIVTALPFQPVCQEDCPGLCSECGARLADDPEHHHDVIDPRWSVLATMATHADDDDEKRI